MKITTCAIILLISLLLKDVGFASTREIIIDETLKKLELAKSLDSSRKNYTAEQKPAFYQYPQQPLDKNSREQKDQTTFYISAGNNANHMHYKEISGGDTLDEDYGKLRGFYINAGYRSNQPVAWLMGKPFFEGYFIRHDALITYDGASTLGPLEFKERAEIQRFGAKLGACRDFLDKGEFFGYVDLGERIWYRGENEVISGVLTYAEKYWWIYLGLGMGVNYRLMPKLSVGLEAEVMASPKEMRAAKMRADLYEGGTFDLKSVIGGDLKIPIKYYIFKNLSFDVTPYFTYWKINKSDPVKISGSWYEEPDSRTHIEGLLVGCTYSF